MPNYILYVNSTNQQKSLNICYMWIRSTFDGSYNEAFVPMLYRKFETKHERMTEDTLLCSFYT